MRTVTIIIILLTMAGCGCPPCNDGMTNEHWKVFECARFDKFIENNIGCIEFEKNAEKLGTTNCDCLLTKVRKLPDRFGIECDTVVHEVAHIEEGCINGETYAEQKSLEFLYAMQEYDCWDLADSFNQGGI